MNITGEHDQVKDNVLSRRAFVRAAGGIAAAGMLPWAATGVASATALDYDDPARYAAEALEGLYGEAGRWEDLIELYQRQLDVTPGAYTELRVKIARVAARVGAG